MQYIAIQCSIDILLFYHCYTMYYQVLNLHPDPTGKPGKVSAKIRFPHGGEDVLRGCSQRHRQVSGEPARHRCGMTLWEILMECHGKFMENGKSILPEFERTLRLHDYTATNPADRFPKCRFLNEAMFQYFIEDTATNRTDRFPKLRFSNELMFQLIFQRHPTSSGLPIFDKISYYVQRCPNDFPKNVPRFFPHLFPVFSKRVLNDCRTSTPPVQLYDLPYESTNLTLVGVLILVTPIARTSLVHSPVFSKDSFSIARNCPSLHPKLFGPGVHLPSPQGAALGGWFVSEVVVTKKQAARG